MDGGIGLSMVKADRAGLAAGRAVDAQVPVTQSVRAGIRSLSRQLARERWWACPVQDSRCHKDIDAGDWPWVALSDAPHEMRLDRQSSRDRQKGRMGEADRGKCSGEWVSTSSPGVMAPWSRRFLDDVVAWQLRSGLSIANECCVCRKLRAEWAGRWKRQSGVRSSRRSCQLSMPSPSFTESSSDEGARWESKQAACWRHLGLYAAMACSS